MRRLAACALLLTPLAAIPQQPLTLNVERFYMQSSVAHAVVRVTNPGPSSYATVNIDCAFLAAGKAVATGGAIVRNVGPVATAFDTALATVNGPSPDSAQCRISNTRQ